MNHDTSLYKISQQSICQNIKLINSLSLKSLPPSVLIDLFETMSEYNLWERLYLELSDLDILVRILRYCSNKRQSIIKCVCQLMQHYNVCEMISKLYSELLISPITPGSELIAVDYGMLIGGFLSECGWLTNALEVLDTLFEIALYSRSSEDPDETFILTLNCAQKLLYVESAFCCFKDAAITTAEALDAISKFLNNHRITNDSLRLDKIPSDLIASVYTQISVLHFHRSEYTLSYDWSCRALQYLKQTSADKITIDVLRQAAKACVVKRKFQCAHLLIKQAVARALKVFGESHLKYSDALMDYGFFLLNVDQTTKSVNVYKQALEIKQNILGKNNIFVAIAHEDLAYALYVLEYNSGRFDAALSNIEICIDIMADLVPDNQLMQASAKRVKALILEEIALDSNPLPTTIDRKTQPMLQESEKLHLAALNLSLEAFGNNNVQTAKHYGNLGRLYQSMCEYEKAERMHKKAIKIKSDLLGCYDYEVGLSIGHLASLYNYHMEKYREAEELYLKSIHINLKLFGRAYSGLEYDYRGLMHIYEVIEDHDNWVKYNNIMEDWRVLRNEIDEGQKPLYGDIKEDLPMEEVTRKFFEMVKNDENLETA